MGAAAAGFIAGACCAASVRACVRGRVGKGRGGSAGARARPGRGGRGGASAEGVWSQEPKECRWDIPISGVSSVVERADRARRRRGRDADCADGERIGAARVRTSEADLASLRGRDMTVTRAVLDIQKDSGKESTGATSGALSLPSVRPRAFAAGSPGRPRRFRVDGTRRRRCERRESLARIRAGDERVDRRGAAPRNAQPRHRRNDESTNQQPDHNMKSASSGHPGIHTKSYTSRSGSHSAPRATDASSRGHTSSRGRCTSRRGRRHAEGCRRRGGRPSRGGRSGIARGHGKPRGGG